VPFDSNLRKSWNLGICLAGILALLLAGCASSTGNPPESYSVGGTVSGLTDVVVLQNNGTDNVTIVTNGSFTFGKTWGNGNNYNITVLTQPKGQVCTVNGATGTFSGANVKSVGVTCVANTFSIGGSVTGLKGSVILQNSGGDKLTINTDGTFAFAIPVADGSPYNVTVSSQPTGQTCSVSAGTGTVPGSSVTSVVVVCAAGAYSVGGTVSGLAGTLILQNNAGDDRAITANGAFTFAASVADGSAFKVTVLIQPAGLTCSVSSGTGTISTSNVTNVAVVCAANPYTVGGTISGLKGTVVLQDNGGDDLSVTADGSFVFATPIADASPYKVAVLTQPAGQTCAVTSGTGTIAGADVGNVTVACATNSYTIGGTITGLPNASTLLLQNDGGGNLNITGTGAPVAFTFAPLPSEVSYAVNVLLPYPAGVISCIVMPSTVFLSGANITSLVVNCF
jgi:hypothetical protein